MYTRPPNTFYTKLYTFYILAYIHIRSYDYRDEMHVYLRTSIQSNRQSHSFHVNSGSEAIRPATGYNVLSSVAILWILILVYQVQHFAAAV